MPTATFKTSAGSFTVKLMPEHAPKTVANFTELATGKREWQDPRDRTKKSDPLYDGTIFHRVIPDFMIQGGDPLGDGTGGPGYTFPDEGGEKNRFERGGVLAMANSGPDTNGSQFFVTENPAPWLNGKHIVFGDCGDPDVVRRIARVPRDETDKPTTPVVLEKVTISTR